MNATVLQCTTKITIQNCINRQFTMSAALCGRRRKKMLQWLGHPEHPYDDRFDLSSMKDIHRSHRQSGKLNDLQIHINDHGYMTPQLPGYRKKNGQFTTVPEMIPEFVVPDLTDFPLKPYVSYNVEDIAQSEFTAKDLFDAVYAKSVIEKVENGSLDVNQLKPDDILDGKYS